MMKPPSLKRDELDKALKESIAEVKRMTKDQLEVMKKEQSQSWAKQDMD